MDPLEAKLAKLSIKNRRRQKHSSSRHTAADASTPPSGLRTPTSGVRTPVNGLATPSSGLATPDEETEPDSEDEEEAQKRRQPFPFFRLPYELRWKVLLSVMRYNDVVDLNVNAVRRLGMFPVSRQWYQECCQAFYGGNIFRLLPLDGPLKKKRTKPLIQHFTPENRKRVTRLELRLGPHWSDPPRCWQISDQVGLEDLSSVRRLDVFVQCDPEHPSFVGFRQTKKFYTDYCGELLEEIFGRIPKLETISIDSWPSVGRDSPLIRRLETEATLYGMKVVWGTALRLNDCYDVVFPNSQPSVYDTVPVRQMVLAQTSDAR